MLTLFEVSITYGTRSDSSKKRAARAYGHGTSRAERCNGRRDFSGYWGSSPVARSRPTHCCRQWSIPTTVVRQVIEGASALSKTLKPRSGQRWRRALVCRFRATWQTAGEAPVCCGGITAACQTEIRPIQLPPLPRGDGLRSISAGIGRGIIISP
jgi:hypothetical protein